VYSNKDYSQNNIIESSLNDECKFNKVEDENQENQGQRCNIF
jgi:hypothetical protein